MPDITVKDLSVSFGSTKVLKSVNLSIPSSKSTVILGGSGSGKSVLLKAIIGLVSSSPGSVLVDGSRRARSPTNTMRGCSMLFQNGALFDGLPSWRNIMFGAPSTRNPKERAMELLEMVDLGPEIANKFPESLSGGMKKRVALARAIACSPHTILLDEPTTGLDPITSEVINQLINKLIKQLSITAVIVTHDIKSALTIADNVAMVDGGTIGWRGTREELLHAPDPLVTKFINASGFGGPIS